MSDRFSPVGMEQLTHWIFTELEQKNSIFGTHKEQFFIPDEKDPFKAKVYGVELDTPFGPAAGPHSQMAQNIIVAWLCGARFMELKTVQVLDEIEVAKPCIDLEDEGYNVEWSQELRVYEAFDEYLRAWLLIHVLHHKFGYPGEQPGIIFNMSVGYNMEGILSPKIQWFLDAMKDSSPYQQKYIDEIVKYYPQVRAMDIPHQISDNITLSTMHGCPPQEIEKISSYLIEERQLHTSVKCNPTLLGPEGVRDTLQELGFIDIVVPDEAFGHDLKYPDAVPMLQRLRMQADQKGLTFGIKLSNTLEVENVRTMFNPEEKMMYLSGRPLHAIIIKLAHKLIEEFSGDMLVSYAAGADCFNVTPLLQCGMKTITVCSDLLRTGGYERMLQYVDKTRESMAQYAAENINEYIRKCAMQQRDEESVAAELTAVLDEIIACYETLTISPETVQDLAGRLASYNDHTLEQEIAAWGQAHDITQEQVELMLLLVTRSNARITLRRYTKEVVRRADMQKGSYVRNKSKTPRELNWFDCIEAPCIDECPVNQNVPQYMRAVSEGRIEDAIKITRSDNPISAILGRVCDHHCEHTCTRAHLDEPLAIREIKRYIISHENTSAVASQATTDTVVKVAVIGAGPAGFSAARELAEAGIGVVIFEMHDYGGGMVSGAIPSYRIPWKHIDKDIAILRKLGVEIRYGQRAGSDFTLSDLRQQAFDHIIIAVGAQVGKKLGLAGEDAEGIIDALVFLRNVREDIPVSLGQRIGVIGAGDTAMDCARTAWRLTNGGDVKVVYRRTIDQMPADAEEIRLLLEEGIEVMELVHPQRLEIEEGRLKTLVCTRMALSDERDSSGRKIPRAVEGEEVNVPLDTMILAVSQNAMLDFFGDTQVKLNAWGCIEIDAQTYETSVPKVYCGGDVSGDGPSSLVKASADGKAIAAQIIHREGLQTEASRQQQNPAVSNLNELMKRRATRELRVPVPHIAVNDRKDINREVIKTYSDEQARQEASRCIDCDTYCSVCTGVCPNKAIMTWQMQSFSAVLPKIVENDGRIEVLPGDENYEVSQSHQIAILTDFCNECGNCMVFCPTSGAPYRDKPRLYFNADEFAAQQNNAFMMFKDDENGVFTLKAKNDGEVHQIVLNGSINYTSPQVEVMIEPDSFSVKEIKPLAGNVDSAAISLRLCADMYVILRGLTASMDHIPFSTVATGTSLYVDHPGYQES